MPLASSSFDASLAYRFYCRGRCRELVTGQPSLWRRAGLGEQDKDSETSCGRGGVIAGEDDLDAPDVSDNQQKEPDAVDPGHAPNPHVAPVSSPSNQSGNATISPVREKLDPEESAAIRRN